MKRLLIPLVLLLASPFSRKEILFPCLSDGGSRARVEISLDGRILRSMALIG